MASGKERLPYIQELVNALVDMGVRGEFNGEVTATRPRNETGVDTNFNIRGDAKIGYKNPSVGLNAYYNYGKNSMFNDEQNTFGGEAEADLGLAKVGIGGSRTQRDNSFYHNPFSTQFNAGVEWPMLDGLFGFGYEQNNKAGNNGEQKQRDQLLNAYYKKIGVFRDDDNLNLSVTREQTPSEEPNNIVRFDYKLPF